MTIEICYVHWKGSREAQTFIEKINTYLEKESGEKIEYKIKDAAVFGEVKTDCNCVCFGSGYKRLIETSKTLFVLPVIEDLMAERGKKETKKKLAREMMKSIASHLSSFDAIHEEKQEKKVEPETSAHIEKDGISIGTKGTDIVIPRELIQPLKSIKELIGGGKMIITKGDIRIETGD